MKPVKIFPRPTTTNPGLHILDFEKPANGDSDSAERLQAVGLFAAGVAHDFNNLLGIILGYCEAVTRQENLTEPARTMIAEIDNAGNAARKLAQGLLAFSSGRSSQPVVVDLNESVRRMSALLASMIGNRVTWIQRLGVGLGVIEMRPGQLEQIVMNLALNARDAMSAGGKLYIETANAYLDDGYAREHPGIRPGNYVRLTVTDTGEGMDAETQKHIFEPFFTTKMQGQGVGLGLSNIAAIVANSGGSIAVHSRPGSGTTFSVYFPCTQLPPKVPSPKKSLPEATVTGTILLVEDCLPLRALTRRILEDAGHTVLDAGTSEDALAIAQTAAGPISLLITDVAMPGVNGFELAQTLTALRAETSVLYMSGHCDDKNRQMRSPQAIQAFLEKPFTRENLLRIVGEQLHSAMHGEQPARFLPRSTVIPVRSPRKAPLACS